MQEQYLEKTTLLDQMEQKIAVWESAQDHRVIFLTCYTMMTRNMLTAVEQGEFQDAAWVTVLLHRFADYYFDALKAYDNHQADHLPPVWKLAFDSAAQPRRVHVLQHLILGVNAHINYDLVFVVVDLLRDEWRELSPETKAMRYADYCHVNEIIYRTIDSVQDQVVERYSPAMDVIDKVFLTLDEWFLQRLIHRWREQVWHNACRLMDCAGEEAPDITRIIDAHCVRRGQAILFQRGIFGLRHLF